MALQRLPDGRVVDIPSTGLIGAEQALLEGRGGALSAIGAGADVARGDIAGAQRAIGRQVGAGIGEAGAAIGAGVERLDPFAAGGSAAFGRQSALSGALGPEAQAEAFEGFIESPGQAFLREQGQQALLRGESAIGGLGGGRVRQELMRQGIGMAAQDFGSQFDRLGSLSAIGAGAAGQQAGLFGQRAGIGAQLRGQQAGLTGTLGQTAGGIAERAGIAGGQAVLGTGRDIAGGRTRAGEQIAGAVSGTTSALADLAARQGIGVSDILARGTGGLADILAGAGAAGGASREQAATILANIATGAGSQRAALPGLPSLQPKTGALAGIGQAAEGVGTLIGAV